MKWYANFAYGIALASLLSGAGLCQEVPPADTEENTAVASPASDEEASDGNEGIVTGRDAVQQLERTLTRTGSSPSSVSDLLNSYTLDSSVDKAMTQNPKVRQAEEKIEQAASQRDQLQSQKNLRFVVGNTTTWQNRQISNGAVVLESLSDRLAASLQLLLTTFGNLENQIVARYLNIGVNQLNAMQVRREVAHAVKSAFFNKLKADASVGVSELNLSLSKESKSDSEKLYAQGVMALYDVVQSDLNVAEAEEQLARSLSESDVSSANFLESLGERCNNHTELLLISPQPISVDPDCTLADLQKLAEARRFELMSLDRSLEVLQKTRDAVDSLNRPEISLSGDYIFSPGNYSTTCSVYQLNLNINWEAWDGGNRLAQLREVDSQIRELNSSREELCNSIYLQVQNAWDNLCLTDTTLRTAQTRVESAWIFHDMARQRFLNGLGTSLEVQSALKSLNEARLAFVVATYDRNLAFSDLEYSVGVDFPNRYLSVTPELMNGGTAEKAAVLNESQESAVDAPSADR